MAGSNNCGYGGAQINFFFERIHIVISFLYDFLQCVDSLARLSVRFFPLFDLPFKLFNLDLKKLILLSELFEFG